MLLSSLGKPILDAHSDIPDKLYFKIGEVAELVGVHTHVLRYWEKELPCVRPIKTATNQRRYRKKEVELLREVKRLLRDEGYTLSGVKKRMLSRGGEVSEVTRLENKASWQTNTTPQRQKKQDDSTTTKQESIGSDVPKRELVETSKQDPKKSHVVRASVPDSSIHVLQTEKLSTPNMQEPIVSPHLNVVSADKLHRVKQGLQDLIRLAGKTP